MIKVCFNYGDKKIYGQKKLKNLGYKLTPSFVKNLPKFWLLWEKSLQCLTGE